MSGTASRHLSAMVLLVAALAEAILTDPATGTIAVAYPALRLGELPLATMIFAHWLPIDRVGI